jgi:hypothetical protein
MVATAGQNVKVWISSTENINNWVVGERVRVQAATATAGPPPTYQDFNGTIAAVGDGTSAANTYLTITIDEGVSLVNATATVGTLIQSMGMPQAEGSTAGAARRDRYPATVQNYTQIWRKKFGFARTALNQPLFWDPSGKYQTTARDTAVAHMSEIENACYFGARATTNVTVDDTPTVRRTMGGIEYFMKEYEKVDGGAFSYRPGGSAATTNSHDNKLIIDSTNGTISHADWQLFEERMFRTTMSSGYEKLVLGGSTAISALLKHYESRVVINRDMKDEQGIQYAFSTIETRHGILHAKSHPRFNSLSTLRKNMFVLDLANLRFRPMNGADTHLREEIQANDFDGRQDEYLTEGSLEVRFPESHMYFRNVSTIATS